MKSHLYSAGLYRLCLEKTAPNPNPVVTSAKGSRSTSDQITAHFLCHDCEQRLNNLGENWVLPRLARQDGSFLLRDMLKGQQPLGVTGRWCCFDLGRTSPKATQFLLYFGASLLWRAAARTWMDRGRAVEKIELGPYQEEFRLYLLGSCGFPSNVNAVVWIDDAAVPDIIISAPNSAKIRGATRHKFQVPGLLFTFFVGKNQPENASVGSLNLPSPQVAFLTGLRSATLDGYLALMKKADACRSGL